MYFSITSTCTCILVLLAGVVLTLSLRRQRRHFTTNGRHKHLPLPPGTLGWPYIGETFQLYSKDPSLFFASKQAKYGGIFKSHVLGYPSVMISKPEGVKEVLVKKAHLFKPTFPASKERILGKHAIFFNQGDYHLRLRKLLLRSFSADSLRRFVTSIDSIADRCLSDIHSRHSGGVSINTFHELKNYTFNVALLSILGEDEIIYREELKQCYYILENGYNSMPINLPGTLFHKSMKARAHLARILACIISSRRRNHRVTGDLLGSLMAEEEGLSDEQIADNVIGVIFAARDTTATVLTWIFKYLADYPSLLQAVTEEQEAITKEKDESGEEMILNWADTKKMLFTSRVIQETMRIASILSFTFREAVEDVEFDGYLIPKGWKVLPLFRNIHHSPLNFPDPEKFDPTRFEVAPKPNTFLPFGNGIHSCPGNELAKLEILVFLRHLTTKYRWSTLGPQNDIQYGPFLLPQNGLPIELHLKCQEDNNSKRE